MRLDVGVGISLLSWAALGLLDTGGPPMPARATAAALNATVGVLFLLRGPALAHGGVRSILRALPSAVVAGLAWRLAPHTAWPVHALWVVAVGGALTVASLATLGRSFAIFPAARPLVERGPYRLVRHPAYLGEVVMVVGCGLAHGPVRGAVFGAFAGALLVPRILDEEALLARDPIYLAYRERVRFRLVPAIW